MDLDIHRQVHSLSGAVSAVSLVTEATEHSNRCRDNSIDLNVEKTKEMLIDFRKAPNVIPDLY